MFASPTESTPGQGRQNSLPSDGGAASLVHTALTELLSTWTSRSRPGGTRDDDGVGDVTRLFAKLDVSRPTAPVGGEDIEGVIQQMLDLDLSRGPKPEAIETIYIGIRHSTERRAAERRVKVIESKVQVGGTAGRYWGTQADSWRFAGNARVLRAAQGTNKRVARRKAAARRRRAEG